MKEFGSDFHYVESIGEGKSLFDFFPIANLYANGRHAIQALIYQNKWKRIWMPEYFCYDIIDSIKKTGIHITFYKDNPLSSEVEEISRLQFEDGDVLFRMNYFGIREFRSSRDLKIPVIEDHSHDLIGDWALNSNADWCIASLRKTLPIAEGGILWSPKRHTLPKLPNQSEFNVQLSERRWKAMQLKKDYLSGKITDKGLFRPIFIETESQFENLYISPITEDCISFLENFNIEGWLHQKQLNWNILSEIQSDKIYILERDSIKCNCFSFSILFFDDFNRDVARQILIGNNIFPVILWDIPNDKIDSKDISDKILSIACDGRYTIDDMQYLKKEIVSAIDYV
jgi:hypothetical protein